MDTFVYRPCDRLTYEAAKEKLELIEMKMLSYGIAVLVLLAMLEVEGSWAQSNSCLKQLVPCLSYLNGTRDVPDSCCDPLKSAIKSNPECLCSLISNNGGRRAEQAGINVNEAQELPGRCGQHVNPLLCLKGSSPGSRKSVQDSSAGAFLFQSQSLMMALVLLMTIQILWMSNVIEI